MPPYWQACSYQTLLEGAIKMTSKNKTLVNAVMQIEAINSPEAVMARHNDLMTARSRIMNASPRGRHFIARHGDPIELKNKLPKAWNWA